MNKTISKSRLAIVISVGLLAALSFTIGISELAKVEAKDERYQLFLQASEYSEYAANWIAEQVYLGRISSERGDELMTKLIQDPSWKPWKDENLTQEIFGGGL